MGLKLSEIQWAVFKCLLKSGKDISTTVIGEITDLDPSKVMGTVVFGKENGWLSVSERERVEIILSGDEFEQNGFAERRILPLIFERTSIPLKELSKISRELNIPMNEIIRWGQFRGWFEKDKGELKITETGKKAVDKPTDEEKVLREALTTGKIYLDEVSGISPDLVVKNLQNRTSLAKIRERTVRLVSLTDKGRNELIEDRISIVKEKNILSSEDIISGEWRNISLRTYDVTLKAERIYPAKIHLMQKIIQQTRRAFLEMGFTEIVSPQVESAFWDFDALFQPQDHPARDMQDTFYMERPGETDLPDVDIVRRVKQTHENGGETGSKGWGYKWDAKKARQVVLRTHTTACTIRALSEDPNPPRKVFCVGKVYRNEAISYKHLPEFFQVDGIIIDENANLATLLGTLSEFYKKMGFDKVKFKPAFFPYTEPSAEVFVYMKSKKTWIELGGSGIFRPEVTRPFGCNVPVLAWGLGLDRLAMLRYGINDIRELFWSDLDRIREVSLCR
jgi:phenylalanyl-tRNA synthetase alpha chain